ncbi:uncharacterized protein At5g49945 [Selaginella moellendorffii]|nr:uncharacterized protein At5g49945 [Selaginella moellendorffii]|eukprot:XP_002964253.2 uncharacterized protein At5g49945 [Selaginella moellendorffii]
MATTVGLVAAALIAGGGSGAKIFTKSSARLRSLRLDQQLWWCLAVISVVAILGQEVARTSAFSPVPGSGATDFDGFGDELDEEFDGEAPIVVPPHAVRRPGFETDRGPPAAHHPFEKPEVDREERIQEPVASVEKPRRQQEQWDEDEFEGLPSEDPEPEEAAPAKTSPSPSSNRRAPSGPQNYYMEAFSVVFLVAYAAKYFFGRKENEKIALAWAGEYAGKGSIFEKNFSLLGIGEAEDAALLMKEGQNVFKFYASGRRYCQGMLATMELKNRQDLISCLWYYVMPAKDEITIQVFMNDESMDNVVAAVARRKNAKAMSKDVRDLQQFATILTPSSRGKSLSEDLAVIAESREVSNDLLTDAVLDMALGEKTFKEHGANFVSLHLSDVYPLGVHRKLLQFKFYLPPANRMGEISRLIQMVPHFIDAVGRYKLSPQARAKVDPARQKSQQEALKQAQNARHEAMTRKREEKRRAAEELESRLSPEALRRKEEKERAKQLKKSMPKMRMTRAH